MRHVLFIHHHFLPVHNVAVKRLVGYAKQLPAFGWRPSVLTKDWRSIDEADPQWGLSWEPELEQDAGCPIHRVPAPAPGQLLRPSRPPPAADPRARGALRRKLVAKTRRLARMAFGDYPDDLVRWTRPAVVAGLRIARRERIDVIMSYCPPETNHVVAHRLARRLDVPWVPFFGDLYGFLEARLPALSVEGFLRRAWHRRCLAPAAACAAVSPYMVGYLARTYRKRTELVLTGFDPDELAGPADAVARRDRLVVSHVGSVYPGDQRPEIFFDGLDGLLARHPEVEPQLAVQFVGSKCDDRLRAMIDGRPAARVCTIRPKVTSATAAGMVRASDGLLAFTCSMYRDRHGTLSYPTKVFEALGARRPILAIPADGDWVDELLARTGGGTSARDAEEVSARLWEWFADWRRAGRVPYHGRSEEIARFSRRAQTERLAQLFDSVCRRGAP
jgi:glycosyltransferase involved in cell wall biosynthesis